MPGNEIDVFLQPFIQELKKLWDKGVETFDASINQTFKMRVALMWTISDFPGLGNLSGWNTHTGLACPVCNFDFEPQRLPHSKKWCFMCHRRFLDASHRFRSNKSQFNGNTELRDPPKILSGFEILEQLQNIDVIFGKVHELKGGGKRSRGTLEDESETQQWKKKSIFLNFHIGNLI